GARSFRNEYDGHTLKPALEQVAKLTGKWPHTATADRGYSGQRQIGPTAIQIPKPFSDKTQTKYQQQKLRKAFKRRAAVEPVIGHLKSDHRLSRNFYWRIFGDDINVMLSASGFNFKRMMNKWKKDPLNFLAIFFQTIIEIKKALLSGYPLPKTPKLAF
ncbi:MAG: hypothetical protein KGM98_01885, partial [Bacteroidota bacterium]|nr:hypothetical protein [Bacteroidota bacterium]